MLSCGLDGVEGSSFTNAVRSAGDFGGTGDFEDLRDFELACDRNVGVGLVGVLARVLVVSTVRDDEDLLDEREEDG